MKGKALRGLVAFGIILLAIWIAWWFNFTPESPESPTLEDSIRRGKERAQIARDSALAADSAYIRSEVGLKQTKNEINHNTAAIAHKRDSLRAVLKARAYADSVNRR